MQLCLELHRYMYLIETINEKKLTPPPCVSN